MIVVKYIFADVNVVILQHSCLLHYCLAFLILYTTFCTKVQHFSKINLNNWNNYLGITDLQNMFVKELLPLRGDISGQMRMHTYIVCCQITCKHAH